MPERSKSRATSARAIDPQAVDVAQRHALHTAAERQADRLLGVMCEITRFKIVRALQATPLAAGDLARVIGKTRSATSQHLRLLRELDLVATVRTGNVIRYRLNGGVSAQILSDVSDAFDRLVA